MHFLIICEEAESYFAIYSFFVPIVFFSAWSFTYRLCYLPSHPAGPWKDLADFPAAQPPGADAANVPTQESWTSDRKQAQLSEGHHKSDSPLAPSLPLTQKHLLGPFFMLLSDKLSYK